MQRSLPFACEGGAAGEAHWLNEYRLRLHASIPAGDFPRDHRSRWPHELSPVGMQTFLPGTSHGATG